MSKKKFKTILCGYIAALCLLLTSCGSLQISQGSGNQDTDRRIETESAQKLIIPIDLVF